MTRGFTRPGRTLLGAQALLIAVLAVTVAAFPASAGERIAIVSGSEWAAQAARAKPGDEIVLMPGVHRPAVLEGLHGTKEAPIVVTSSTSDLLAEIAADPTALRLVDCSHVRLERIVVRDAPGAAIVIEAGSAGGCREIAIESLLVVHGLRAAPPEGDRAVAELPRGVVVRDAEGVSIDRSRVDGARDAGILIERSRRVALRDLQVVSGRSREVRAGIEIGDAAQGIEILRTTVAARAGSAFVVGPATSAEDDAPPGRPARGVRIHDSNVHECDRALELGAGLEVSIERLSARNPAMEFIRLAPVARDARDVRIDACAFVWEPGRLKRLVAGVPPADPSGVGLGDNLWFSRELPMALPLLGPPGDPWRLRIDRPQRTDLDPQLNDRGASENPLAQGYGRLHPTAR